MRKKSIFAVLFVAILVVLLALAGCGQNQPQAQQPEKLKPNSLEIGTAAAGGVYVFYGNGVASLASQALGIPVTGIETDGPNHNLILIQDGDIMLGLTTMGPAFEAWNGIGEWTGGQKFDNVRSLFPMFNTYFHWVADADSGIANLRDMDGKRVGSGPKAGTIGVFGPRFFELLGIEPANISWGALSGLLDNQGDGLLDATGFAAGIPVSGFREYESRRGGNVVYIGVDGADRDKLLAEWEFLSAAVIPKGTYDALTNDLQTVGMFNIAIAHKDLHDDYVYEIVKAVMENNEFMVTAHSSAKGTVLENFKFMDIIPLHPGAIRYFRERNIDIPSHLIPPEYK